MSRKQLLAVGCLVASILFCGVRGLGQMAASDDAAVTKPIERCDAFFAALGSNVDLAYDTLLKDSPLREKGKLDKVAADTKKLFNPEGPYGKPRKDGVERVKTQRIGNDLVLLRYLQKFEKLPVVWYFTFYQTSDGWVLVTVRFDHEYELLGL